MTITAGDIKFVKSQVFDDVPEGGGAPTATVINDGTSNGIFPDISELDRAGGRVNLRKTFVTVRTANVDGYYGTNVIVAEPYADPRVSVTLQQTDDFFDRRADAASRMEAYLSKGPIYQGYLFGDHVSGQMNVALLQRSEQSLPVVGQTLLLRKGEGTGSEFDQYIRITDVASLERTFTDASGDFKRTLVTVDISDRLQADFPGFDALRYDASINYTGKTKTFDTVVADAATYYGCVPLQVAATLGDYNAKATGIYTQLVPSTRIEVPIADARMNQQSATLVEAGDTYNRTITSLFTTGQSMFVGGSILQGSVSISRGGVTLTDKGGILLDATSAQVGTVDYTNGVLFLSTNVFGTGSGSHAVSYKPAYAPTLVSQSIPQYVTAEGQRLSWTLTLDPPPAAGTLQVSYRALGKWYELRDDGSGALRGSDSSFGAGTLNPTTGTVSITLGAMPDVESAIVYTFVPKVVSRRISALPQAAPTLPRAFGTVLNLGKAIKPGTLTLTWNDGSARTSTDSGGVLSGDATGAISYGEGRINFRPNNLPASGTTINVSITETVQKKTNVANFTDGGSNWTCSLPAPLKPNTVEVSVLGAYNYETAWGWTIGYPPNRRSYHLFDDGAGNLLYGNGTLNVAIGSVDYATGAVSILKVWVGISGETPTFTAGPLGGGASTFKQTGFTSRSYAVAVENGPGAYAWTTPSWGWWGGSQTNALEARYSGADASSYSTSFDLTSLFLPANPAVFSDTAGYATKFSSFFIGSSLYALNQSSGVWARDPSPTTGLGTNAGANAVVDGMAGVLLSSWPSGASSTPTGIAGAAQPDTSGIGTLLAVDRAVFRTAVSPLLNGGFNLAGNWATTGASFSVSADSGGVINSGSAPVGSTPGSFGVFGVVDYEMGLCSIAFGRRVPVSMEGDADVIDISDLGISGVTKIQSVPVQSDTLRYNATGYSYLPSDPDILGLNPVRLPADGRVPIFRSGTFAVVGHTGTIAAHTYSNGDSFDCGRERLSRVRVIGNDGIVITTGYTVDLDTGLGSITSVSGWSQPVTIEHRIEDMVRVSDVQINGQLTFTRPLTHNYPVGSFVSSALVAGDIHARVSTVFDQATWSNAWADSQTGSAATGTFNDAAYPIEVTNIGALKERWAVVFTNNTSFNVIGEHVGVIATGNTSSDCAPTNPLTGQPYFSIPHLGWGLGWTPGNVLRFNTEAAMISVWVARTILEGPETVTDDSFTLLGRGDVDRP